jgi:hypothetical protein
LDEKTRKVIEHLKQTGRRRLFLPDDLDDEDPDPNDPDDVWFWRFMHDREYWIETEIEARQEDWRRERRRQADAEWWASLSDAERLSFL